MQLISSYSDKKHEIVAIIKEIANKTLEPVVKTAVWLGTLWFSLTGLIYLGQTFGA